MRIRHYIEVTKRTAKLTFNLGEYYQYNPPKPEDVKLEIYKKGSSKRLFYYPAHEVLLDDVVFFVDDSLTDLVFDPHEWFIGKVVVCDRCCSEHDLRLRIPCDSSFVDQQEYIRKESC